MSVENLVKMVNQIEAFFKAEADNEAAIEAIANHLRRFWDPRMRRQILHHVSDGGAGLSALALEAVKRLER